MRPGAASPLVPPSRPSPPLVADALLRWLVKLPPRAFAEGALALAPVLPVVLLAALGVGGTLLVAWRYARVTALPPRGRALLAALRTAALLLLLGLLLRPAVVVASAVPQRNVLAVVVDDSRSMRLPAGDGDTTSRLARARALLADSGALMRALGARFVVRRLAGGASAVPVASLEALRGGGTRTDLAQWMRDVPEAVQGAPLAGVVLVSDGADNTAGVAAGVATGAAASTLPDALEALRARGVPVHTVALGASLSGPGAAVTTVRLPPQLLAGGAVLAEAAVRMRGLRGAVPVVAEVDGRAVAADSVRARDGTATVRLRLPALTAGVHRVTVRVPPRPGEAVAQDNRWDGAVAVRAGPDRVLVLEGEPRPEFAFLRRAVLPDSALALTAVLRTAKGKFLRLGVRDSVELLGGFPATRAELFAYRAVVLGSLEAAALTGVQLQWLAEFVSVRGGGLLLLGGRAALSEGGYAGTALEAVLPLALVPDTVNATGPARPLRLGPTAQGEEHPALQLAPGRAGSAAARQWWASRPVVTTVNRPLVATRGATVLLAGRDSAGGGEHPVLAWQRYGRGVAAVLAVQDLWLWQMDAAVDETDRTLPLLWRQLLRWLAEEAPTPLQLAVRPSHAAPGDPVVVRAQLRTTEHAEVGDALLTAVVRVGDAPPVSLVLEPQLSAPGDYVGTATVADTGRAVVTVVAARGRDTLGTAVTELLVDTLGADQPVDEEGGARLRAIARATGGQAYTLDDVGALATDAAITRAGVTVKEAHDLWDMPLLFLVLLALLGAEWGLRRWWGLA
jgi:hypothetical protein